jgi:hypothetical protein
MSEKPMVAVYAMARRATRITPTAIISSISVKPPSDPRRSRSFKKNVPVEVFIDCFPSRFRPFLLES